MAGVEGTLRRDLQDVGERGVGEGVGRGVGDGARHVAHGVVDDAVALVDGVVVGGLVRGLDAAALIDGHVDDHRPGLHRAHHVLAHDDGRPTAGHQHGADDQVGLGDRALDGTLVGGQRHDPSLVDLVDPAQPVEVLVEQQHLGLHAGRDPRRVPTDVAGAEDHHPRRAHAGGTAHQHPAAAVVALQELGPHLRGQPSGDLGHGGQERQRAVGLLHRLVGDARRPGAEQRLGHVRVGREVEVGEQREVGPEQAELVALGLLDLDDHLLGPGVGRGGDDGGARRV